MSVNCILFPTEAESIIQNLEFIDLNEFGSEKYFCQVVLINKLSLQSIACIQENSSEFIKEDLLTFGKVDFLIRSLIAAEIWRDRVFKFISSRDFPEERVSYPIYLTLNNELVLANLIESVTYHADAMETIDESAIDFTDWCYRQLCHLVAVTSSDSEKIKNVAQNSQFNFDLSTIDEIKRQNSLIMFQLGMRSISLVCYLIEHSCTGDSSGNFALPLSVKKRLLNTHDVPLVLCHLMELQPWYCNKGNQEWHESGVWRDRNDTMNKSEGQIWLSLYMVLLHAISDSGRAYDLTQSHRKQAFLRLRTFLTDTRTEYLPILEEMRKILEQLAITDNYRAAQPTSTVDYFKSSSNAVASMCLIEVAPEYFDGFLSKYDGKWLDLAESFMKQILEPNTQKTIKKCAGDWVDLFGNEAFENMTIKAAEKDPTHPLFKRPICVVCNSIATKRCSRCKHEWYCRRQCQVEHWKKHKSACDLLVSASTETKMNLTE